MLFCIRECLTDSSILDELKLLAQASLMAAKTLCIPTAAGNTEHTAHGFDAERYLVVFDEDMLHFRRFAKYVAAILEKGQLLVSFHLLAFDMQIFSSQLTFRRLLSSLREDIRALSASHMPSNSF